jgi:hypothetical protein
MKRPLHHFALLIALLASQAMAANTAGAQTQSEIAANVQLSFRTLDGDMQQVNVDEIWRIRAASTRDEPVGTIVINYAYERIFVKDTLENVVDKVRQHSDIRKFTLPSGAPVYIVTSKVISINRPIPQQDHQNSRSVIVVREGRQQVQESREAIRESLVK